MGSSLTSLHIYSSLVSICDYFLGYLLDSTDVLYQVPVCGIDTTKGTRGSSHRGIRGSYICAVWSETTPFITLFANLIYFPSSPSRADGLPRYPLSTATRPNGTHRYVSAPCLLRPRQPASRAVTKTHKTRLLSLSLTP